MQDAGCCSNINDQESNPTSSEDDSLLQAGMNRQQQNQQIGGITGGNAGHNGAGSSTSSSVANCYGRNMTFPRHSATSYGHRHHELPAIVTEGENYRLSAEVCTFNS